MEWGMGNNIGGKFWKLTKRTMTRSETKNMSLHLFFLQRGNYFNYKVFDIFFVNKIELPIGYKYKLLFYTYPAGNRVRVVIFVCFTKTKFTCIKVWSSRASIREIDRTIMLGQICDPTL
jgi:hypothetical protein